MIEIAVYDEKDIPTDSLETKEMVGESIKKYIIDNWESYVGIKKTTTDVCTVRFRIKLDAFDSDTKTY